MDLGLGLNEIICVFMREERVNFETWIGRRPCEDGNIDWTHGGKIEQGMARIAAVTRSLDAGKEQISPQSLRGNQPWQGLDCRLLAFTFMRE